jgi:hypothetical protein
MERNQTLRGRKDRKIPLPIFWEEKEGGERHMQGVGFTVNTKLERLITLFIPLSGNKVFYL